MYDLNNRIANVNGMPPRRGLADFVDILAGAFVDHSVKRASYFLSTTIVAPAPP